MSEIELAVWVFFGKKVNCAINMSDESVELDFTYLNSLSHKSECVSVDFHSEDSLLIANFHFHSFAICNLRLFQE